MNIDDVEAMIKNRKNYVEDSFTKNQDDSYYILEYKVDAKKVDFDSNKVENVRKTFRERWLENSDGSVVMVGTYSLVNEEVIS